MTPVGGKPPVTPLSIWLAKRGIGSQKLARALTTRARRFKDSRKYLVTHRTVRSWRDGTRKPNPLSRVFLCQVLPDMNAGLLNRLLGD